MGRIIERIVRCLNFVGLLSILFYFSYVGFNLYMGSGIYFINITLLITTLVYLLFYIYSVYIEENKKVKKMSKKIFKRIKKVLALLNACLVFVGLFSANNSFLSIVLAIVTLVWQIFYTVVDLLRSYVVYRVKKNIRGLRKSYDYRG